MSSLDSVSADRLIRLACLHYNGADNLRHHAQADKLLKDSPQLASASFHAALVTHNTDIVKLFLAADPGLAKGSGGPLGWPAAMYITYSRVNHVSGQSDAIDCLDLLLQHGTDADASVLFQDIYRFTALTGAMGEGEQYWCSVDRRRIDGV